MRGARVQELVRVQVDQPRHVVLLGKVKGGRHSVPWAEGSGHTQGPGGVMHGMQE